MASSSSAPVYVDDRDPTLSYSGVWFTGTFTSDYQNSSHGTNTAGSSVSFSFTGTQVSVYGSVDPSNSVCISSPISTYMVDNTSVTTYFALATETKLSNCLFFESPVLEGGLHSLVITSASQNGLFWFDYIQYTPSASRQYTEILDSAPTTNTGSIIGGAVGGVLLLAIIVSLSIFAMRRKRLQGSLFPAIREAFCARSHRNKAYNIVAPYITTPTPSVIDVAANTHPDLLGAEFEVPQMMQARPFMPEIETPALQSSHQPLSSAAQIATTPLTKLNNAYRPRERGTQNVQPRVQPRSSHRDSTLSQDTDLPPEYQSHA